ncbi:glycosyltransferase [Shewanella baltica]|uniref:glycosyltransferase n=1 Tax=Shewanella baltica TaxID=62322 RepID=UPI003D7BCD40
MKMYPGLNTTLAIVMPTYNRAEFVDFFLKKHIERLKLFNVGLYISNNASTDNTLEVIAYWKNKYEFIFVKSLTKTVTSDENIENAVFMPNSKYIWILGDSYEILPSVLDGVLGTLVGSYEYDFILTNLVGRYRHNTEIIYNDKNLVIDELTPIIACISCNIINRKLISHPRFEKYRGTDFGIVGFVLDYIASNNFSLLFCRELSVVTLKTPVRKVGWPSRFFEIMFYNWPSFVANLPDVYSDRSKDIAKKLLVTHSGILSWRSLLHIRGANGLNFKLLGENKNSVLKLCGKVIFCYMFFLCLIPSVICKVFAGAIEWIRRKRYQLNRLINPKLDI